MKRFYFLILCCSSLSLKANDSLVCSGKFDPMGKKHGVWICATPAGKLVRKERYKHGELSTWLVFNAKGQVVETRNRKGKIKKYTPCGC